jgi:hypothetical protein
LRRYYSFTSAYPFDWWITPERGVLGLLDRPDVDWLYDPRELELAADRRSVQHRTLGVMLHHEFPRHGAWPNDLMREDFRDFIATPRERTGYLLDRFFGLDQRENRILFVREDLNNDPLTAPARLEEALARRFRHAEWSLFRFAEIADELPGWHGDPVLWDAMLARIGVALEAGRCVPFDAPDPTDESIGPASYGIIAEHQPILAVGFD